MQRRRDDLSQRNAKWLSSMSGRKERLENMLSNIKEILRCFREAQMKGTVIKYMKASVLQHVPLCTAVPGDVARKELTSNSQFVVQAKEIKSHKGIERLVQHIFKAGITTTMSSKIRFDLLAYEDGCL
jgi:hypothetical protein